MKTIEYAQLNNVVGGGNTGEAATITAVTSTGGAIGAAIAGPLGAVVGAIAGSIAGNTIVNNKEEVAKGLGAMASAYAKGHKDGGFNGMPMAFQ